MILRLLFIFMLIPLPTMAQTPLPSSHPVKAVEQQLQSTKAGKKKLQEDLKNIENELSDKRKKLISIAKDISRNEKNLVRLENNIATKQEEQVEIEQKLREDKKSISDLVLALERIRRVPPEAVIARPDTPLKTAQSTMLLHSILPRVHKRAEQLKTDLEKLNDLLESLEKDRNQALTISKKLKTNQKSLSNLLSSRESIYAKTEKDIEKRQTELKQISLQARNLKDLVRKIEEKQARENKKKKEQKRASKKATIPTSTPIPKSGEAQLPVSGTIFVGYGKTDDIGAVSQGIKIKTRPNALIVAPMGGVVDYAGQFKGYGQIIILKHQKGYHSLIAGLAKIDTVVGRAVAAGEPIGIMSGSGGDSTSQTLYYELRYKGHPVNPSKKIHGLK